MKFVFKAALAALAVLATASSARAETGKIVFASDRTGTGNIFIMNPDGTGQTQLTNTPGLSFGKPAVSPSGAKIVFESPDQIWEMNYDGSGQSAVTNANLPTDANFVPNSNLISLSADGDPDWAIYTIDPNGANRTKIVQNMYGSYYGRWNPAGTKIAFLTFLTSIPNADIFIANPDGSGQTELTTTHADRDPAWSPDGTKIVFQSTRDGSGSQIYVMNADGTNQIRLTDNGSNDTDPTFSPDGTEITFASDRTGTNQIYTMNLDGTNQTRITNDSNNDITPFWAATAASTPSAAIGNVTVTAPKTGTGSATFNVTLSAASTATVTVAYQTADGTAVAGTDYTAESGTLTFAPGVTTENLAVPILTSPKYAPNKTFTVGIEPIGSYTTNQIAIGTIVNAYPEPSLTIAGVTENKPASGTSTFNFPVTLSAASSVATTVNYATANGTAIAGTDYVATSGTLTIPAGSTTGSIAVTVDGSAISGPTKTFTVSLSGAANATLATSSATGSILNPSTTPGLSAGNASANEGSPEVFTLTLTSASSIPITISYATANGTGTAGVNYVATSGSVTIPAGQLTATVTVNTLATGNPSLAKTFDLNITAAPGAVITNSQGVGTIVDTVFPKIYLNSVSLLSGNTGTREMYFSLCLSDPAPFAVSFNYATSDGTAVAGKDYTAISGTCTLPAGVASQPLGIPIFGTTTYGPNKTFTVTLSAPVNGTILTPTGTGTIISSAKLPAVYINNLTEVQPVSGTASAPFHITLTNPSSTAITLNYATASGTAVAGTDFTSASGTITFPPGATIEPVTVTILGHASPKNGATFTLNLSSPNGASIAIPAGTCTLASGSAPA